MARQRSAMCENVLRSDGQQRNYSKAKFPSNLNCGQIIVSETGPSGTLETRFPDSQCVPFSCRLTEMNRDRLSILENTEILLSIRNHVHVPQHQN